MKAQKQRAVQERQALLQGGVQSLDTSVASLQGRVQSATSTIMRFTSTIKGGHDVMEAQGALPAEAPTIDLTAEESSD